MDWIEVLKAVGVIVGVVSLCIGWGFFLTWLDPDCNWYVGDEYDDHYF